MKVYASEKIINSFYEAEKIIKKMEELMINYSYDQNRVKEFLKSVQAKNFVLTNKK
jgi:hypothetical protein